MKGIFQKILIFSFLLQALIPIGFMPAYAHEKYTIVICSGVAGDLMTVEIDGEPSDNHSDTTSSKCAYSMISGYTFISSPNIASLSSGALFLNKTESENTFFNRVFFLPNYSRGPPHISLT